MLKSNGFYRGINLGGWLSQCDYSEDRMNNFITESDFAEIARWGLDHVRIPIDYNVLENEDGTICEDGCAHIDNALELCRKYGLNTVLDLHKTAGFSFDAGEKEEGFFAGTQLQERFYSLWEMLAQRYGQDPEHVAFELLNEVTDKSYLDEWNRISNECIRRIRAFAPKTLILVGSYWNNSAAAVKDLTAPYDDRTVYNFHCYEPLKFTHQGATWTDQLDPADRFAYDECDCSPEFFEEFFAEAIKAAKQNNTVLYCGEYGVIDHVSPEDTLRWYRAINEVFEKYGIARSAWSYKEMDFGIADARLDGIRRELLGYL